MNDIAAVHILVRFHGEQDMADIGEIHAAVIRAEEERDKVVGRVALQW